jgi:hypothetical protein
MPRFIIESAIFSQKGNNAQMWKFIKILLALIALLAGGIFGFAFIIGYAVYDAIDETANKAVVQQVTDIDGRLAIRVPLQEEYGMVINGFRKCSLPAAIHDEPDFSASCTDGFCTIVVTFDEQIPDSIGLYVEKENRCRYERFITENKTKVVNHFAKIEINDALESALEMPVGNYDVGSLKSLGHITYELAGSKKVILNYGEKRNTSDVLTIDNEAKASILFE